MSDERRSSEKDASGALGAVAIGRNEGERLQRCLVSLRARADRIVYVDSGSTDGSVAFAMGLGIDVVELDPKIPFTAARARNEGFDRLVHLEEGLEYVQFVDGDCEVVDGWMERARRALDDHPDVAATFGRRRERYPEKTIYNTFCDIEWDTPVGETTSCGGDAMMRVVAFEQAGRFDPTLIAGEEPELCCRFRLRDWKILCIDAEMTLHDAAMTRLGQLWRRAVRAGHAYAEGAWMHGAGPLRHNVRECGSILAWTVLLPWVALGLAWPSGGWSLLLLVGSAVPVVRHARYLRARGRSTRHAWLYSLFCFFAKLPHLQGMIQFLIRRASGRQGELIEYK